MLKRNILVESGCEMVFWEWGGVIYEETLCNNAIEILGVVRMKEKDELDTVRLGRHRFIDNW